MKNQNKEASSRGGKIGGKISPTNFKNNPSAASEAGKKSKRGKSRSDVVECPECQRLYILQQYLNRHLVEKHGWRWWDNTKVTK